MVAGVLILKPAAVLSTIPQVNKVVSPKRVDNWREQILELYPTKDAPLIALLKTSNRSDREFSWWTDKLKK